MTPAEHVAITTCRNGRSRFEKGWAWPTKRRVRWSLSLVPGPAPLRRGRYTASSGNEVIDCAGLCRWLAVAIDAGLLRNLGSTMETER
jgi:hypothetical protein